MTNNTKNVDWTQPIEAVHEDGRVVAVEYHSDDGCKVLNRRIKRRLPGKTGFAEYFNNDGTRGGGWTIRNVVEAKAGDDEWGPEIKVEGKRPEWLGIRDAFQWTDRNHHDFKWWGEDHITGGCFNPEAWDEVLTIRLPSNHPHYAQNAPETHRQGTNGVRTSQECLDRMEALVRRMAGWNSIRDPLNSHYDEAREITALLPEPVDPDLVEAREACAIHAQRINDYGLAAEYRSGELDQQFEMQAALIVVRGRALERGEG